MLPELGQLVQGKSLEQTCVQDNSDHLLLCQIGFDCQRLFHEFIDGLELASVAHVRAFHFGTALVTHHDQPFLFWLSSYVVVTGGECESASSQRGMLGTHRFFEVETGGA